MNNPFVKILCGDSREKIKRIKDNSVQLILTDPPYLITKERWDKEEIISEKFVQELRRMLTPSGSIYI